MKKIIIMNTLLAGLAAGSASLGILANRLVNKNTSSAFSVKTPVQEYYDFECKGAGSDRYYYLTLDIDDITRMYTILQTVPNTQGARGACLYSFLTNNIQWAYHDYWGFGEDFWRDLNYWNDLVSCESLIQGENSHKIGVGFDYNKFNNTINSMKASGNFQAMNFSLHVDYQFLSHNKYGFYFAVVK